jgi:glutamate synthase (NADPH) large chain
MSGGVAYVLDEDETFRSRCNQELVLVQPLFDPEEMQDVYDMIERYVQYTSSNNGKKILANWDSYVSKFVRVIPKSYLKMRERISELENSGLEKFDAEMAAFEEGTKEEKKVLEPAK